MLKTPNRPNKSNNSALLLLVLIVRWSVLSVTPWENSSETPPTKRKSREVTQIGVGRVCVCVCSIQKHRIHGTRGTITSSLSGNTEKCMIDLCHGKRNVYGFTYKKNGGLFDNRGTPIRYIKNQ